MLFGDNFFLSVFFDLFFDNRDFGRKKLLRVAIFLCQQSDVFAIFPENLGCRGIVVEEVADSNNSPQFVFFAKGDYNIPEAFGIFGQMSRRERIYVIFLFNRG